MSDCDPAVASVRDALSSTRRGDEDLDGAVLTRFAAVVEWMDPDGEKWLSIVDGDAGDQRLKRWDVQGLLFNVMHDPAWQHDDEEDDE